MGLVNAMVSDAQALATKAHKGQMRWSGLPYITHPEAVAAMVRTDEEKAAAWLHDVVEDTEYRLVDLVEEGIPLRVVDAVDLLTKRPGQVYLEYLVALKDNDIARNVKIADIRHNLSSLDRTKHGNLFEKYQLALYILTGKVGGGGDSA